MTVRKLENLTFKHVEDMDKTRTLAILPIGSMEQHGPHIPLGQDTMVASTVLTSALDRVGEKIDCVVLPPIPIGQSPEHMGFAGTLTFSAETFIAMIKDICASLSHHGFKKLLIVNGHGGNISALNAATFDIRVKYDLRVFLFHVWSLIPNMSADLLKREASKTECHGGELETSVMLALDPDLVVMEWAVDEVNPQFDKSEMVGFAGPVYVNWDSMLDVAPSGIGGQPSYGSIEKGKVILDYLADTLSKALLEICHKW